MASQTTDQKPVKKQRRRIALACVGTKEAGKLRRESIITKPTQPSKPRRNSNVQDIVDGLRQILDAYDGSMGGPRAKATNSTGGTDAQLIRLRKR